MTSDVTAREGTGGPASFRFIAMLSAAAFATTAGTRIADPLLPQVAEELHVGVDEAAVVATGFTLAYGLCQVFWGPMGDRYGKYRLISVATFVGGFATLLCAFATDIAALGLARLVAGALSAAIIPLSLAHIGDHVPYEKRQSVLARFLSGQVLGIITGQAAGGILGLHLGWRGVFVALAVVYVVIGVLLIVFGPRGRAPVPSGARGGIAGLFATYGALARRARVRQVVITVFFEGFLFFGAFTYVGALIRREYGLDYDFVGLCLAAFGIGALLYTSFAPRIVRLLGEGRMITTGSLLLAAAFGSLVIHPPAWLLPLPVAACGLGYYLFHNTMQTKATQMAPEARGVAISVFAACFFTGQALGVTALGALIERAGFGPAFVVAAVCLPVLAALFRMRLAAGERRRAAGEAG
ncbi:MFS transporter [Zavarzinia compransoris]|uniref:MFS transporter n=1 Tax=Zavarzinia marina TaxID=2911065 RepID=UPI001F229A88|nr:MFS transporter [Zavarzinia marina]MCF4167367.1 MFS transporter [Zavarzinia marina]